ncbi:MAG TPA: glycosyltransferase [Actinomycetota bacterium]
MIALRFLGGAFGLALFVAAAVRYGRRDVSRLNLIITALVAIAVILLAIAPSLFNPVFDLFNFRPGGQRRLVAVLLFADILVFALLFRNMAYTDSVIRNVRLLIESLAVQSFDWSQTEALPRGDRIVVTMPAHNEQDNVGEVIRAMPKEVEGIPVVTLVVDDASEDGTSVAAQRAGGMVVRLPIRRGQGSALRVGYEMATRLGAVAVASLDADGQHIPDELPLVVTPVLKGEADMVVGSRVLGQFEKESTVRHLGIFVLSGMVSLLHGVRVTDVSSGFRGIKADVLRRFVLEQDQYSSEVLVEALRHRIRIKEVPITVRARASGVSKKPTSLKYGWNFTKVMVQTWLR